MDTRGEAGMSGEVTMAKVPPETGLEGDDNAVTHATEEPSVLSAMAADAASDDRELGVPRAFLGDARPVPPTQLLCGGAVPEADDPADADGPVVARFADDQ